MSKILLVEDEENIRLFTKINLEREGFEVLEAESGEIGVELALKYNPQVVILDVMLPGIDGFEVCKILREKLPKIGIIMLTAKNSEIDKVLGLEFGADDYVTKPFSTRELMARVKVNLRRVSKQQEDVEEEKTSELAIKDIVIYPDAYVIKKNGDRELFDRVKLANSTRRSVGKFFKSDEEVDNIITAVEDSLYALGESEVTSKQIGDQVLDELAGRNEVAYIRFASVFYEFKTLDDFVEILAKRREKDKQGL